jgi:hypothetical protein
MKRNPRPVRSSLASQAGYSLAEFVTAMGIMTVVMGATMGGLAEVIKGNDAVLQVTGMNNSLRAGMDLIVRDLLQVGSGLPPGHTITIPNGAGSQRLRLPGPPGSTFQSPIGATTIAAVIPGAGAGPVIDGVATDTLTVLMADNTFLNIGTTAVTATSVTVAPGPNLATGADRVTPGQLMMIMKGSFTALVQVTNVNTTTRVLTFANGDSLRLNQSGAAAGNLGALNAAAPANSPAHTNVSRVRMITYYLDGTIDPNHPRLIRRVNNGHPLNFDNTSGTAVALDIENLQLTYDISNGTGNPGGVEMTDAHQTVVGVCTPTPCAATQIRKVNVLLTGRSMNGANRKDRVFRNTLQSQVSLRGMAFVDEYKSSY